jgi:peptidoglycan-associated lipoprotein
MRLSLSVALVLTVAIGAAGCGKKKVEIPPATAPAATTDTPTTRPPTPPPPSRPPEPTPAPTPTEDELFARETLEQLNQRAPLADVFFDYDSVDLREESRNTLQKHMTWLKRWPSTKFVVEGHADSRGTNEYNLALAERRAAAVRDYLVSLGLSADRVTIVSLGEEQPACTEESEACWQSNRRGRFRFTAK